MGRFRSRVVVSPVNDGVRWYLVDPLVYQPDFRTLATITVPAGFITDFASVPQALQGVLPRWGTYGPAAIVHDWLYWDQSGLRADADDTFNDAMLSLGVPEEIRKTLYEGVHVFGEAAWQQNTARKAAGESRIHVVGG